MRGVVEVRTHRQHDGRSRLSSDALRPDSAMNFSTSLRMLTPLLLVLSGRRHRIKLLPLIDVDQQPVRLLWRRIEAGVDNTSELTCVARTIGSGFVLKIGVDLAAGPASSGTVPKASPRRGAVTLPDETTRRPTSSSRAAGAMPEAGRRTQATTCRCLKDRRRHKGISSDLSDEIADRIIPAAEEGASSSRNGSRPRYGQIEFREVSEDAIVSPRKRVSKRSEASGC